MSEIRLDVKNRKILSVLDWYGRLPIAQIARKVRLSKEVTSYRIKQLEKKGIIEGYYSVIDYFRLGYFYCRIFIRFHSISPDLEKEIVQYVIKEKNIGWICSDAGEFDLGFSVCKKNIGEFETVYNDLNYKYGAYFQHQYVSIGTKIYHFPLKFLFPCKYPDTILIAYTDIPLAIDDIDKQIISLLSTNARMSILAIAKKLRKSSKTIMQHKKNLENKTIIASYRANINLWKLGFQYYKLFLIIKNMTKKRSIAFIRFCQYHPDILYLTKAIGFAEIELELVAKSTPNFIDLVKEIRFKFGDFIKDYKFHQILKCHAINYLPAF